MRGVLFFLLSALLTASCQSGGRIKLPSGEKIVPPKDSDQPTTVESAKTGQTLTLPAGTTISVIHHPATPTSPESTETTYTLAKDATQTSQQSSQTVSLSPTRKPDTTVALHQADLAERRILLYAAIACLLVGIALKTMLPAWPGASTTAWVASAVLFAAWKFSEVPWWAAALVAGLYVGIAGGYKRAEVDVKTTT